MERNSVGSTMGAGKARSQEDLSYTLAAMPSLSWPSNPTLSNAQEVGGGVDGIGGETLGRSRRRGYEEREYIKDFPSTQELALSPPNVGGPVPVSTLGTNTNKLSTTLKKIFGSNPNLTEDTSILSPIANQSAPNLPLTPSNGGESKNFNKFTSSTPGKKEFMLVSGVRVKNEGLFQIENNRGFLLRDKMNRKSIFLRWDGQLDLVHVKFQTFIDLDVEKLNFLYSRLGDIASPVNTDGSYHIFGVKSYLKVILCTNCRKGKISNHYHHLVALLGDLHNHKTITKDININDLDLKRDFNQVATQAQPVFNTRRTNSVEQINSPNYIVVPNKLSRARIMGLLEVDISDELVHSLNLIYYPMGEITGDISRGFKFCPNDQTPSNALVFKISLLLDSNQDELNGLENLLNYDEPAEKLGESIQSAVYCLFAHWANFRLKRNKILDPLFNLDRLNLRILNFKFGLIREAMLPVGLITSMVRAYIERQINLKLESLGKQLREGFHQDFNLNSYGEIYLSRFPDSNLLSIINHASFPPISIENNSIIAEYLYLIQLVLSRLASEQIEAMGLEPDITDKLSQARQLEEQQFMSKKGLLHKDLRGQMNLLAGDAFDHGLYNHDIEILPTPNDNHNFRVFHDSSDKVILNDSIMKDFDVKKKKVGDRIQESFRHKVVENSLSNVTKDLNDLIDPVSPESGNMGRPRASLNVKFSTESDEDKISDCPSVDLAKRIAVEPPVGFQDENRPPDVEMHNIQSYQDLHMSETESEDDVLFDERGDSSECDNVPLQDACLKNPFSITSGLTSVFDSNVNPALNIQESTPVIKSTPSTGHQNPSVSVAPTTVSSLQTTSSSVPTTSLSAPTASSALASSSAPTNKSAAPTKDTVKLNSPVSSTLVQTGEPVAKSKMIDKTDNYSSSIPTSLAQSLSQLLISSSSNWSTDKINNNSQSIIYTKSKNILGPQMSTSVQNLPISSPPYSKPSPFKYLDRPNQFLVSTITETISHNNSGPDTRPKWGGGGSIDPQTLQAPKPDTLQPPGSNDVISDHVKSVRAGSQNIQDAIERIGHKITHDTSMLQAHKAGTNRPVWTGHKPHTNSGLVTSIAAPKEFLHDENYLGACGIGQSSNQAGSFESSVVSDRISGERNLVNHSNKKTDQIVSKGKCPRGHVLGCFEISFTCDVCSRKFINDMAMSCQQCNYDKCSDCCTENEMTNLKGGDKRSHNDQSRRSETGSNGRRVRSNGQGGDDDDDDDDNDSRRGNNRRESRNGYGTNPRNNFSLSSMSPLDYKRRKDVISYRLSVLGKLPFYKIETDFSVWYQSFRLAVEFLEFDEAESRLHLLGLIPDLSLRNRVASILSNHPSTSLNEVSVHISIALGSKSLALISAEGSNSHRRNGESVFNWAMRAREVREKMVVLNSEDANSDAILASAFFRTTLLNFFLSGLRSRYLVKRICKANVKDVGSAIVIIDRIMAELLRIENLVGSQDLISIEKDQHLFANPSKAIFYANMVEESAPGDLDVYGQPMGEEICAIASSGSCGNCGRPPHRDERECPAMGKNCNRCNRPGHFGVVCSQYKTHSSSSANMITPAQYRHSKTSQNRRANTAQKIHNVTNEIENAEHFEGEEILPSEFGSLGIQNDSNEIGLGSRSPSPQLVNSINNLKKKYGKKIVERELKRINTIDNICSVSPLPFVYANIIDSAGNVVPIKLLFDSGSSISLVTKEYLDKKEIVFLPQPYESTLVGFNGQNSNCYSKGTFALQLSAGHRFDADLIILHGRNLSYDGILGYDLQKRLKLNLDHSGQTPCVRMKDVKIPVCSTFESVHSIIEQPGHFHSDQSVVLRGMDLIFLPIIIKSEAGFYDLVLDKSFSECGLKIEGSNCLLFEQVKKRQSCPSKALLPLKLHHPHKKMLKIGKEQALGSFTLAALTHCTKGMGVNPVEEKKVKFANAQQIVLYPVRVVPSQEKIDMAKKEQAERQKWWTRERILKKCEWLEKVPDPIRERALELMLKYSGCLVRSMEDLRLGMLNVEVQAKIPEGLYKSCVYKSPPVNLRALYRRVQTFMVDQGLCETAHSPSFIHPFTLCLKILANGEQAKFPSCDAAAEEMTPEEMRRSFRIVQDCSMLTEHCAPNLGYLTPLAETLATLRNDSLVTLADLKDSFHQILLSGTPQQPHGLCCRDLFGFYSYVAGHEYLRSTRLVMGFCNSSNIASFAFKRVVEVLNLTPIHCSVAEFEALLVRINKGEKVPLPTQYYDQAVSYLDDNLISSPANPEALKLLPLTTASFFFPPTNELEACVALHLNVLAKFFSSLLSANLLISPSKMAVLAENFKLLGFQFTRIGNRFVKSVPQKRLTEVLGLKRPDNLTSLMSLLGFLNYFQGIIPAFRVLLFPMIQLLKKGAKYVWTDEMDKNLALVQEKLVKTTLDGYCQLSQSKDISEIWLMTDYSQTCNAAAAVLYTKCFVTKKVQVALFWSKLLSKTFLKKPPYLGELGAACLALLCNKAYLLGKCVTLICDNQACVRILQNRAKALSDLEDGIAHRLLLSIQGIPFRCVWVNTKAQQADYMSRNVARDDPDIPVQVSLHSSSLSDLDDKDMDLYTEKETVTGYMSAFDKKKLLTKQLAEKDWSLDKLKKVHGSSHVFPADQLVAHLEVFSEAGDENFLEKLADREEVRRANGCNAQLNLGGDLDLGTSSSNGAFVGNITESQLAVWSETTSFEDLPPVKTSRALDDTSQLFDPWERQFEDPDFFRTKKNGDIIDFVSAGAKQNPYDSKFMISLRNDTETLAQSSHSLTVLSSDGLIPNDLYADRLHLCLFLAEHRCLTQTLKDNGYEASDVPLFMSREQVLEAITLLKLGEHVSARKAYFVACQTSCPEINLLRSVVNGTADSDLVDLKQRTSSFFRACYIQRENLYLHKNLLFRIRLSLKGERHLMQIVLSPMDSRRKLVQYHSKTHNKFMFTYACFSNAFYTPEGMKLCIEVVKGCPICEAYSPRRRLDCQRLQVQTDRNYWYVDYKGPIRGTQGSGGSTGYIFVGVEATFKLLVFNWSKTIDAKATAQCIFDSILCVYGSGCTFKSDRGSSFCNQLNKELFDLGSIHHSLSPAYSPRSELCETLGVRKLSSVLRNSLFDVKPHLIKSKLKQLQFVMNNLTRHPYTGSSPFQSVFQSRNSFFHPALEVKDALVPYDKFWKDRMEFLAKLTKSISDRYDLQLSQMKSNLNTVTRMRLKIGSLVWYRIFKYGPEANNLKSLMPKFNLAKIVNIQGPTALILTDQATGRLISRNLLDVYKAAENVSYPNLYLSIPDSTQDDNYELDDEAQGFIHPVKQAELDITTRRENELNEHFSKTAQPQDEAVEISDRILRPRKPVKYTK